MGYSGTFQHHYRPLYNQDIQWPLKIVAISPYIFFFFRLDLWWHFLNTTVSPSKKFSLGLTYGGNFQMSLQALIRPEPIVAFEKHCYRSLKKNLLLFFTTGPMVALSKCHYSPFQTLQQTSVLKHHYKPFKMQLQRTQDSVFENHHYRPCFLL